MYNLSHVQSWLAESRKGDIAMTANEVTSAGARHAKRELGRKPESPPATRGDRRKPVAPRIVNGRTEDGRIAVSVPEAAAVLGISISAAWDAVNAKSLRSARIGHRVLVPVAGLEAMMQGVA